MPQGARALGVAHADRRELLEQQGEVVHLDVGAQDAGRAGALEEL